METIKESLPSRPEEKDFDEHVQRIRGLKESGEKIPGGIGSRYELSTEQIKAWSEAWGAFGREKEIQENLYPGWTMDDFQTLRQRLKKERLIDSGEEYEMT